MYDGPSGWGTPLYERVLDRAGAGARASLLDLGCGAGQLCRQAADRGTRVTGLDRDPRQAAALVPEGAFVVGDMLALPFRSAAFHAVVLVQSIMHVPNPLTALREAARVARPGARVVVTVWGPEEDCDIRAFGQALTPLLSVGSAADPAGDAGVQPPPLHADGRLERLARLARLDVAETGQVVCAFRYPDDDTLLTGLLGSALGRRALSVADPETVRRAVLAGLAGYRTPRGGYRLDNTFRYLVATGPSPETSGDVSTAPPADRRGDVGPERAAPEQAAPEQAAPEQAAEEKP